MRNEQEGRGVLLSEKPRPRLPGTKRFPKKKKKANRRFGKFKQASLSDQTAAAATTTTEEATTLTEGRQRACVSQIWLSLYLVFRP